MTHVRTPSTILAATLLILCVGLQILEASGRWDRTVTDAGDEAVIVTVILCVGSAFVAAHVLRNRFLISLASFGIFFISKASARPTMAQSRGSMSNISPPVSLRI